MGRGSRIWDSEKTYPGSRSKKYQSPDPDPQHCTPYTVYTVFLGTWEESLTEDTSAEHILE
jgi:hypothetical protein